MTFQKYAIIVAGGSGTRMGTETPKQFLLLAGKPILMHTLQRFIDYPDNIQIILVLPSDQFQTWKNLCHQFSFSIPHILTEGGKTRFESVQNGLNMIPSEGLVAIHDGVRPFVNKNIISTTFEIALKSGNGIASVALKDSIRSVQDNSSFAEDRSKFRLIQTPQTFKVSLIKHAFSKAPHNNFTDDASVLESTGEKINLTEGSYENIKITTPEDLIVSEALAINFKY